MVAVLKGVKEAFVLLFLLLYQVRCIAIIPLFLTHYLPDYPYYRYCVSTGVCDFPHPLQKKKASTTSRRDLCSFFSLFAATSSFPSSRLQSANNMCHISSLNKRPIKNIATIIIANQKRGAAISCSKPAASHNVLTPAVPFL